MKLPRIVLLWLAPVMLCLNMLMPASATAAVCTGNTIDASVSPPALAVSRNVAPGTILYQVVNARTPSNSVSCSGVMFMVTQYTTPLATTALADVYQTNVPGIGIKVVANFLGVDTPIANTTTYWGDTTTNWRGGTYFPYSLYIVATGPVSPGTVSLANPLITDYASASSTSLSDPMVLHTLSVNPFNVTVENCTTPSVAVNMGNHSLNEMPAVGSTTSTTSFSIALNSCPSGMNGIEYELDPVTTIVPGTGNSVVTLDSGSTAVGIGLQVLDGSGNPFSLGTPVAFTGYNASSGGSYTIPLQARYYRTASPVVAGSANTAMTFTMTYQ